MCIKDEFNKICFEGSYKQKDEFLSNCDGEKGLCPKFGSCDYYSLMADSLKTTYECFKCGEIIKDDEAIYTDNDGNDYCEDCWIEFEAKLKKLYKNN